MIRAAIRLNQQGGSSGVNTYEGYTGRIRITEEKSIAMSKPPVGSKANPSEFDVISKLAAGDGKPQIIAVHDNPTDEMRTSSRNAGWSWGGSRPR